ncbi:Cobalt-zinc-cadmium resistance protein CzcC [bioreactor metagenome]|uniref:Cobalt-zinc-cadmium resistance protein CzcC n=1 Tax=bioreactor metagenome TaxID=1076179 RepID=A0A644V5K4_9ZZZZ|nr:TolC family protein [Macellibacteroides fermentans]
MKQLIATRIIFAAFLLFFPATCYRTYANSADSLFQHSISFRDYLNIVGKENLNLLIEKYHIKIADANIVAAKVMPDPEIAFEGADESYEVALSYNLELGNKRGARIRVARSEAELTNLLVEHFFQELRAESTDAYLNAILQRELLATKKSSYEYMLQLSISDSLRFRLGEVNENDARQSKLEAATLLNEVFRQEAEYKSSLAVLNLYMCKSSDILILSTPSGQWNDFEREYELMALISIALDNRIDLIAAQKSNELAVNQLKLVKAERRMDLGLSIGYERDWKGVFPNHDMMKAGISIPLKFSNINKGSTRAAQYAIEQSRYEEQKTRLQIQTEVSQAYYLYDAAKKQVKQYKLGLFEDSKKVLDGIVYKYKRGETTILDVLIAQRTYNEVQEQYLRIMKEYASSLVNLQKVCGIWDIEF